MNSAYLPLSVHPAPALVSTHSLGNLPLHLLPSCYSLVLFGPGETMSGPRCPNSQEHTVGCQKTPAPATLPILWALRGEAVCLRPGWPHSLAEEVPHIPVSLLQSWLLAFHLQEPGSLCVSERDMHGRGVAVCILQISSSPVPSIWGEALMYVRGGWPHQRGTTGDSPIGRGLLYLQSHQYLSRP